MEKNRKLNNNYNFSKNNIIIQCIPKRKEYVSEANQICNDFMLELHRKFNIFDKNYERTTNDTKNVYNWFVNKYNDIFNSMNIALEEILDDFNQKNHSNLSITDLYDSSSKLASFYVNRKVQKVIKHKAIRMIKKLKNNNSQFNNLTFFNNLYFSIMPNCIYEYSCIIGGIYINTDVPFIDQILEKINKLSRYACRQVIYLNSVLHEYQIICYGKKIADILYKNATL